MKRNCLIIGGLISLFALSFILGNTNATSAADVRIVRLNMVTAEASKQLYVEPDTLWIKVGTVVVWVNQGPTEELKVVFEDGTRCQDVTDAGSSFAMSDTCYVTSWVPIGGTSSLKFDEAGDFDYVVESATGTKSKGEITVHSSVWKKD